MGRSLTDLTVQDFLLTIAEGLDDLKDGVEQAQVAQPPRLIIKLLPLSLLGHAHKDVARLLLANRRPEFIVGLR